MEKYKIVANYGAISYEFQYIPENFEGMKISQNFSFLPPIGYTPKYGINSLKIIKDDKTFVDNIFLNDGLNGNLVLSVKKLNNDGLTYSDLINLKIDFESYIISDFHSEFSVDVISVIDAYNKIKNTEIQVDLTQNAVLPTTQKQINYVS